MENRGAMTNEERLQKTIRLEKVDKILSGPSIEQFAAVYAGITQKDYLDPVKAEAAREQTFEGLGGWDIMVSPVLLGGAKPFTLKTLLPGKELPDNTPNQIIEEEVMLLEDYDYVIQNGLNAFMERLMQRMNPGLPPKEERDRQAEEQSQMAKAIRDKWQARGITFLSGGCTGIGSHPFETFSFHRSLAKFSMDLRRTQDKVKAAVQACVPDIIANLKKAADDTGCRRVLFTNSRGSSTFINNKTFEDIVLPSWLEIVDALDKADIDVAFHCDSDWTRFLPYFKEFPRGRCILQLDGATDIYKAKEILNGHMAIQGDVPASLLTLGTPEQVYDYCKQIIEAIGKDGGFILSSGCSTPFDSKFENVRAMLAAGRELTWL